MGTAANPVFIKPLIVVEGFEPSDAAPLLGTGNDYSDFIKEISKNAISFNGATFNDNLDNIASYDLIYLNYNDGTDDIVRNAALLEEVINWVNAHKAANAQQNVVMGISMGGLVSRYCLAKMTKENHNPQTRLLITHDSPHRGANIPLGAQALIKDFSDKTFFGRSMKDWLPLLKEADNLSNRPATLQQLIIKYDGSGVSNYNTFLANNGAYRQMITFSPSGPQPAYQFIATSQGSQCGIPVLAPSASLAHSAAEGGFSFILGAFGGKFKGQVDLNCVPNGGSSQRITYFNVNRTIKIFWIGITKSFMNINYYSPDGILGWDGCPAGTQAMSRGTGLGNASPTWNSGPWFIPPLLFEFFYSFDGLQIANEFSFVPTVSALDEDNITATSLYAPHVGAFYAPPANSATALQRYIAQEEQTITPTSGTPYTVNNINHTDFTARNAHWLFNEMENIANAPVSCSNLGNCNPFSIALKQDVCAGIKEYAVNTPANLAVNWSVAPSGMVIFNTSNNSIKLFTQNSGTVTITATFTDGCGLARSVNRQVSLSNVFPPLTPTLIDLTGGLWCAGTIHTFGIDNLGENAVYNWTADPAFTLINPSSSSNTVQVQYNGGASNANFPYIRCSTTSYCYQTTPASYTTSNFNDFVNKEIRSTITSYTPLQTVNNLPTNNANVRITLPQMNPNNITYNLTSGFPYPEVWGAYANNKTQMFVYNRRGGTYSFSATATNNTSCGTFSVTVPFTVNLSNDNNDYERLFTVNPNPVFSTTTVALNPAASSNQLISACIVNGGFIQVDVLDFNTGAVLSTVNGGISSPSVVVNMSALPVGIYLFRINARNCPAGIYQEVQQVLKR